MANIIDIETVKTKNNISIKSKNTYYQQSLYVDMFYSDKELDTFCRAAERVVRRSEEYSAYIGNLKANYDLTSCSFFNNITTEDATIEMHHYPFTLYDIVYTVVNKFLVNKEPFKLSTFMVAKEVIKLHFLNKVGLVPLSLTVHELVHAGELFIHFDQIFGRFEEFVEEYGEYMTPKMQDYYNLLLAKSQKPISDDDYNILNYNKEGVKNAK